jgi:uncharacterized membrane protein YraQ (UPF0718 family)
MTAVVSVLEESALLLLRVAPYFAIGTAGAAAFQTFVPQRWMANLLGPQNPRALGSAITAGALLPGCSCTTIPLAQGLKGIGGPRVGTLAAFIFVSPLLSPITVIMTFGVLGWEMTVARMVASIAGALALGMLVNSRERKRESAPVPVTSGGAGLTLLVVDQASTLDDCGPVQPIEERSFRAFRFRLREILRTVLPSLLLGMLIGGAITALLPEEAIPRFLGGSSGIAAYVLAAAVGMPVYICEGEEVPITYALLAHGLGPGPSLTFLLGAVGTCIPTILMARTIIGNHATRIYLGLWIIVAIGAGVAFEAALRL